MSSPYRTEDSSAEHDRAELLYRAGDSNRAVAPARAALQLGILGAIGSALIATAGHGAPAAVFLVGCAGFGIWRWRRAPDVSGILFSVDRGELTVKEKATGKVVAKSRLLDLVDVRLDTKEIRKVVPGGDAIPAVSFTNTNVNPGVDVARIVLVLGNEAESVRLTDQFLAHMDSVEWVGKIRSFLRKQGWVPKGERDDQDEEEEA